MKIRNVTFLFFLVAIISCNKNDDSNTGSQNEDDSIVNDDVAPKVEVNGFTDVIETITEVSVEIEDESSVSTKVFYNEEELAASEEKQFSLTINPYEIEIGPTDFLITSVDEFGNEASRTFSVDIKHLLCNYNVTDAGIAANSARWLFINTNDGQQLAVKRLALGENKIYTNEVVEEDDVLYTELFYDEEAMTSDSDGGNVALHTIRMPLGIVKPGVKTNNVAPKYEVEVKLNGVPYENSSSGYSARGYNYTVTEVSGDDQQTTLTIEHESDSPILIRTNSSASRTPFFDGKKDKYKYTVISAKSDETELQIEADELVHAEDNIKLTLPVTDEGFISFYRKGFVKASDFENNEYFEVYDVSNFDKTKQLDYIDLPVLPMLEYYVNDVNYHKNGLVYYTKGSDDNLDLNLPNWQASLNETDLEYEIIADNPEVDMYGLYFETIENRNNNYYIKSWYVETMEEEGGHMSFPKIELPDEIIAEMTDDFFKTNENFDLLGISAVDYDAYDSYFEIIDKNTSFGYFPYTDVEKYRMIIFVFGDEEGKSRLQRFPWERYSSFKNH